MHEGSASYDRLVDLAEKVRVLLGEAGTLALKNGDYWVLGTNATIPSVDVLIFQTMNFTPDLLAECANLLDEYPEDFRLRFIEGGSDGKPLAPLGGLMLNRYGGEPIT